MSLNYYNFIKAVTITIIYLRLCREEFWSVFGEICSVVGDCNTDEMSTFPPSEPVCVSFTCRDFSFSLFSLRRLLIFYPLFVGEISRCRVPMTSPSPSPLSPEYVNVLRSLNV